MTYLATYQQYMDCYADALEHYWTMEENKSIGWEAYTYNCYMHWKSSWGNQL